jgi:hypothetical protein
MKKLKMHRGVTILTAIGFVLFGGVSPLVAADETKKSGEQVAPRPSKTPTVKKGSADPKSSDQNAAEKKTPDKKAAAKDKTQKSNPTAASKSSPPSPKYTSAEKAASGQACFGETPKIDSVVPDEAKAGEKVTISGKNFGPAECLRSVSFGPGYPATFKFDSPTQITATVPSGRRSGLAMLTVTTASGEDSRVFAVK